MKRIPSRRITSPFLIGIFVIVGSAVMIALIIWLGANQFLQENVLYVTYFDGSVEGLQTGSSVKYQGVPVGTINNIKVAPDGKLVEVIMQIEKKVRINDSLRVKAEYSGIAGGKFLQLYYPENEAIKNLYPKLSFKPPLKLIKSAPSGIQEIELAARDVLDNLRRFKFNEVSTEAVNFLRSASKFFSNEEMYQIISRIDTAAWAMKRLMTDADTSGIVDNLQLTAQKLLQVSVELDYFTNNLNNQIDNLHFAEKVDNVFLQYDTTMNATRKVIGGLGYSMETMIFSLNETVEEIRSSNKQLQKTLRAISDNPSQVFFSEPPPAEK